MTKLNKYWLSKVGLKAWILDILNRILSCSDLLCSRGWSRVVDWSGTSNLIYPSLPTRYRVNSLKRLRGKSGLIWIRLGSDPPKPEMANGAPGDLVVFSRDVVGQLGGKTILITTDGDRSIPSGISKDILYSILNDKNIVAWYTQNLDGNVESTKLFPIPIGLDLHSRVSRELSASRKKAKMLSSSIQRSLPFEDRHHKIWSDVHLEQDLGTMANEYPEDKGKPGAQLYTTRLELRYGINSGALDGTVDYPKERLPLSGIWRNYGIYKYVISLPGHGLDCHRTWEALLLGACVITVHSWLDPILEPYRVIFIERKDNLWWKHLDNHDWLDKSCQAIAMKKSLDLSWNAWVDPIRQQLSKKRETSYDQII